MIIKCRTGRGDWASESVGFLSDIQVPRPHKRPTESESGEGQHGPFIKSCLCGSCATGVVSQSPLYRHRGLSQAPVWGRPGAQPLSPSSVPLGCLVHGLRFLLVLRDQLNPSFSLVRGGEARKWVSFETSKGPGFLLLLMFLWVVCVFKFILHLHLLLWKM